RVLVNGKADQISGNGIEKFSGGMHHNFKRPSGKCSSGQLGENASYRIWAECDEIIRAHLDDGLMTSIGCDISGKDQISRRRGNNVLSIGSSEKRRTGNIRDCSG